MNGFADGMDNLTAIDLEKHFEERGRKLRLETLPLAKEHKVRVRDQSIAGIKFDNHPYNRNTIYGEVMYLADHAGRWRGNGHYSRNGNIATHVVVEMGTRLYDVLMAIPFEKRVCPE